MLIDTVPQYLKVFPGSTPTNAVSESLISSLLFAWLFCKSESFLDYMNPRGHQRLQLSVSGRHSFLPKCRNGLVDASQGRLPRVSI